MWKTSLLLVWVVLGAGVADAQVYYSERDHSGNGPHSTGLVAAPRFPRLYNFLQVVTEPATIFNGLPYPGYRPSPYPLLDASPKLANATFFALTIFMNAPIYRWAGFAVPPALRAVRVVMYGPPAGIGLLPGNRILWIASPAAAKARTTWAETGNFFHPPILGRPFMPRLHARRHGW
ncbi:MAG: hypothetical protein ACRC8S_22660 [Fimbriiglobus sp.]